MAWLGVDALPMVHGWSPEPQLHAPDIGSLVRGILDNRIEQQQLQQQQIAQAVKNIQSQQQASAFGTALQNAGVVPGGVNLSGMSGPDLAKLADLYQGTIPDKDEDRLKQAQANEAEARANAFWTYGGTAPRNRVDFSEHALGDTWIDQDSGLRMIQTTTGPKISQQFSQQNLPARPKDINVYTHGYDVDTGSAWEDPNDPNTMQVPTLNANYNTAKPDAAPYYNQAPNPNYDPNQPESKTNSKTITHTVAVPKNVWSQYSAGGAGGAGGAGAGGGGGAGGQGKYKVGDSITLKDGSTKTITAINPDGSYQVQ